ncbi:unnamed protein product [Pedinophyceae sp. YPF-701]|nr:unnamed protein product [Pedinophyceae sp. YPF-701]
MTGAGGAVCGPQGGGVRPRAGSCVVTMFAQAVSSSPICTVRATSAASRPVARVGVRPLRRSVVSRVASVEAPATNSPHCDEARTGNFAAPPFTLKDIRDAIPDHCFERDSWRSMDYLIKDVVVVAALAYFAATANSWLVWPLYWLAQGTMFWALFVVGHDCGHGSFSGNSALNQWIGRITHTSILVPYNGWRISHRTHHANHGHIENDESWVPMTKSIYDKLPWTTIIGRFTPINLFAFPIYLAQGAPGKEGSHYDPNNRRLFNAEEGKMVSFDNKLQLAFLGLQGVLAATLGIGTMFKLYWMPWLVYVAWLDFVTFMHHHGAADEEDVVPWYRGEEWSYLRGGLSTRDHDYGMFNSIHHDIGTHVAHHLFPTIPHYNLREATNAIKPVLGDYYKEPKKAPGPFPFHLIKEYFRSLKQDHYVVDDAEVLRQQTDPNIMKRANPTA